MAQLQEGPKQFNSLALPLSVHAGIHTLLEYPEIAKEVTGISPRASMTLQASCANNSCLDCYQGRKHRFQLDLTLG